MEFALRGLVQSMAQELAPKTFVAHFVIEFSSWATEFS